MIYITNNKSINTLPETTAEDSVYIFCKDTDTFKVDSVNMLLKQEASIEFLPVAGKDDMLICLGAIIAQADACTILVPSIPVPKRYADKVTVAKAAKVTKPRAPRKRRKAAETPAAETPAKTAEESATGTDDAEASAKQDVDLASHMHTPEQAALQQASNDEFDDPTAKKMFELLSVSSSDIGYSWPTQMLMLNICSKIAESEDDEELEGSIKSIRNGEVIWERMKDNIAKAKDIASGM